MPFKIVRNDITRMQVDAIVNAANTALARGGGVCGAIHNAAGPQLEEACMQLGSCKTGGAKITGAFSLPCRYVIHAVGPVWEGGHAGEAALLASCYKESLALAEKHGCQSIAFPLISSGIYGYPKAQALQIAIDAIGAYLLSSDADLMVYLVLFTGDAVRVGQKLFPGIAQFIDDCYAETHANARSARMLALEQMHRNDAVSACAPSGGDTFSPEDWPLPGQPMPDLSLRHSLSQLDESFSQMVLRKIREKGIKNAECYKKANADRKLFSKLASSVSYAPKKTTAVAFAIALELPLDEARELLAKAGYALSRSSRFDVIIEYCIAHGIYNIHEVNVILYEFDQPTLGC